MMKEKGYKQTNVTFDSESTVYEEIKILAQQVSEEIPDDSPHFRFKTLFNKELNCYQIAYSKNQQLLAICDDLSAKIVQAASKINTILKVVKDSDVNLNNYKSKYEEILNVINTLHGKEEESKSLITSLRKTVVSLSNKVNNGDIFSDGSSESYVQTKRDVDMLKKEIEKGNQTIDELSKQINDFKKKKSVLQAAINELTETKEGQQTKIDEYLQQFKIYSNERLNLRDKCLETKKANKELMNDRTVNRENIIKINDTITKKKNTKAELVKMQLDEVKKMRDTRQILMKKGKRSNELVTSNGQAKNDIEMLYGQIEEKEIEIKNAKIEVGEKIKEVQTTQEEYNELTSYQARVLKDKHASRKEGTTLKRGIVSLQQDLVRKDNETKRLNRNTDATIHDIGTVKMHVSEQDMINKELSQQQKTLTNEKYALKIESQNTKIKMRNFEKEIDSKTDEFQKIVASEHLVVDDEKLTKAKIDEDTEVLDTYVGKIKKQSQLCEEKRDERNDFKKKLQKCNQEYREIMDDIKEEEKNISELKRKIRKSEKIIAQTHFNTISTKNENILIQQGNEDTHSMIIEASRASAKIQSQIQLLNNVYDDFVHKKSIENKKMQAISTTSEVIKQQIIQRDQLSAKLKYNIKNILNNLEKGKTMFAQKEEQIDILKQELLAADRKQEDLLQKVEHLNSLKKEQRRFFEEYNGEMQKAAVMVSEIGIKRNVHRLKIYETVNPTHAQHIKYHMALTSRLDEMHRECIETLKERDNMIAALEKEKRKILPEGKQQAKNFMLNLNNCKTAIAEKDAEIKELNELILQTRCDIEEYQSKIDALRGKVTCRKQTASVLHTKNYESRTMLRAKTAINRRRKTTNFERADGGCSFFVTQNPTDYPDAAPQRVGGGFVINRNTSRSIDKNTDNDDCIVGTAAKTTPRNTKSAIYRPKTARKRPGTTTKRRK